MKGVAAEAGDFLVCAGRLSQRALGDRRKCHMRTSCRAVRRTMHASSPLGSIGGWIKLACLDANCAEPPRRGCYAVKFQPNLFPRLAFVVHHALRLHGAPGMVANDNTGRNGLPLG